MLIIALVLALIGLVALVFAVVTSNEVVAWVCIGASVVGPQAGELIHELMYAVGWEALPAEAAAFIHAHPTLSETIGETLMSAAGRGLH